MRIKRLLASLLCAASCIALSGCELDLGFGGTPTIGDYTPLDPPAASQGDDIGDMTPTAGTALDDLQIIFLDVGQADCTLLHNPSKNLDILIDGGNRGDGDDIVAFLEYLDIGDLDIIIATHPHEDHIGGLPKIISAFDVGIVYMPYVEEKYMPTTKIYEQFLTAIADSGVPAEVPEEGAYVYDDGELRLRCLYDGHLGADDYNTYSLVFRASYGDIDIMLTGDADKEVEAYILDSYDKSELGCEVLKAGHHGSSTASGIDWLKAVSPEIATLPCEAGNSYGHPHDITVRNLQGLGIEPLDMREFGTVMLQCDGLDYSIFTKLTGDYPLGNANYKNEIYLP